jgi:hypothetical protein
MSLDRSALHNLRRNLAMKTFLAVLAGVALCLIAVILYGTEFNLQKARPSAPRYSDAAGKADAQARYHSCVSSVETHYSDSWATACNRVEAQSWSERNDCIARALPWDVCSTITIHDGSPDCALPVSIASELNAVLEKHRDHCLQEVNAGLR